MIKKILACRMLALAMVALINSLQVHASKIIDSDSEENNTIIKVKKVNDEYNNNELGKSDNPNAASTYTPFSSEYNIKKLKLIELKKENESLKQFLNGEYNNELGKSDNPNAAYTFKDGSFVSRGGFLYTSFSSEYNIKKTELTELEEDNKNLRESLEKKNKDKCPLKNFETFFSIYKGAFKGINYGIGATFIQIILSDLGRLSLLAHSAYAIEFFGKESYSLRISDEKDDLKKDILKKQDRITKVASSATWLLTIILLNYKYFQSLLSSRVF